MEYIRSLRTGIMAEYPVMSTSQGTCVRIEQTSEAIRVTYEICREDARTGIENCWSSQISSFLHVGTRSCIYIFVLLQKQEYILQRDRSCLAEAPPMTRIRICCVVNFTREWRDFHA